MMMMFFSYFLQAKRALYVFAAGLPTSCTLDVALQSGQGLGRCPARAMLAPFDPLQPTNKNLRKTPELPRLDVAGPPEFNLFITNFPAFGRWVTMVTGKSPKLSQITCCSEVPFLNHRVWMSLLRKNGGMWWWYIRICFCHLVPIRTSIDLASKLQRSKAQGIQFYTTSVYITAALLLSVHYASWNQLKVASQWQYHPISTIISVLAGDLFPPMVCCLQAGLRILKDLRMHQMTRWFAHNISQQYVHITNPAVEWTFTQEQHSAMICGVSWSYNIIIYPVTARVF